LGSLSGGVPAPATHNVATGESLYGGFQPGNVGVRIVGVATAEKEVAEGVVDDDVDMGVDPCHRALVVERIVLDLSNVEWVERHSVVAVAADG